MGQSVTSSQSGMWKEKILFILFQQVLGSVNDTAPRFSVRCPLNMRCRRINLLEPEFYI